MTTSIPAPADVDAEFLSALLETNGFDGRVRRFDQEPVGTGQIGQCIRYRLDLDGGGPETPTTVVGKFASDDATSRATGVALRNYLKEVRFYRELQHRVTIRTPACYYAEIEGDGPTFALFMEDLAPAVQGNQLDGCSPEVAVAAAAELVGLHGPSWNDNELAAIEWVRRDPSPDTPGADTLYGQLLGPFFDRFRHRLAPDEAAIIERVAGSTGPPWHYDDDPTSLVHVDYRLDNVLIDERGGQPVVTVVDWQSITVGNPLSDVAYFLGAGLLPEHRPSVERTIVADYHRRLTEAGVEGYGWDRCWDDYRRGAFHGFAVTVIASTIVVETERGNDMFTAMARRHARHALDLGAEEFL